MAGAGVDKLLIGPSMPEPKDFMSYWKRELKKQAKIPMNILPDSGSVDRSGYRGV